MRVRWRWALPVVGSVLFAYQSYISFYAKSEQHSRRYWYWGTFVLDSDPVNRQSRKFVTYNNSDDCVDWGPLEIYVYAAPGIHTLLGLSAIPAFLSGGFICKGLGGLGISEVKTFMISMPVLLSIWYYLVGWFIDRRRPKRSSPT